MEDLAKESELTLYEWPILGCRPLTRALSVQAFFLPFFFSSNDCHHIIVLKYLFRTERCFESSISASLSRLRLYDMGIAAPNAQIRVLTQA